MTGVSSPAVREYARTHPDLGVLLQPRSKLEGHVEDFAYWAADNGCFNDKTYVGDAAWLAWLSSLTALPGICEFVVAPDVVGDAAATLDRSAPHLRAIRSLGFPAALVAQDGLENLTVPWDDFDVLFIGGTDDWKLGQAAARLVGQAKAHGKGTHLGRVNSYKRLRYAEFIGCDTADGTFLRFHPDNLHRMDRWFRRIDADPCLPW